MEKPGNRPGIIFHVSLWLVFMLAVSCSVRGSGEEKKEKSSDIAEENTLVVYSSHSDDLVRLVIREYQERTGIRVKVVQGGTGELLARIRDERNAPVADVVWGGGVESHETMKSYYSGYVPADSGSIRSRFLDPEHKWTGFSSLPMVIIYNKKLVPPENVPKTWRDLGNPEWRGRIACADPSISGSAFTVISTIMASTAVNGTPDLSTVGKIIRNIIVPDSSSAVYKGVSDGVYPVGLTFEEAAIRMIMDGSDTGIVYPEDGTSAVPDGIVLLASSRNVTAARQFIDFVVSADVQRIMSRVFMRRSVRSDIETPAGLPDLETIRLIEYDVKKAAENTDTVRNLFMEIRSEAE